jgi:hypothetical protein
MKIRAAAMFLGFLCALSGAHGDPSRSFQASTQDLTPADIAKMTGQSWSEGCPVLPKDLVSIHMTYIGYDDALHDGVLIIHRRLAKETVEIFKSFFDAGFQIERMQPYEDFPVGTYADSNDTVGFYCRPAQDDPTSFSWHAYGLAVDINPMTNPYHDPKEGWWPPGSAANSDRNRAAPGLLNAQSDAVRILLDHGWAWSGVYPHAPDYMHFGKVTIGGESNPLERPIWAERLVYAPDREPAAR